MHSMNGFLMHCGVESSGTCSNGSALIAPVSGTPQVACARTDPGGQGVWRMGGEFEHNRPVAACSSGRGVSRVVPPYGGMVPRDGHQGRSTFSDQNQAVRCTEFPPSRNGGPFESRRDDDGGAFPLNPLRGTLDSARVDGSSRHESWGSDNGLPPPCYSPTYGASSVDASDFFSQVSFQHGTVHNPSQFAVNTCASLISGHETGRASCRGAARQDTGPAILQGPIQGSVTEDTPVRPSSSSSPMSSSSAANSSSSKEPRNGASRHYERLRKDDLCDVSRGLGESESITCSSFVKGAPCHFFTGSESSEACQGAKGIVGLPDYAPPDASSCASQGMFSLDPGESIFCRQQDNVSPCKCVEGKSLGSSGGGVKEWSSRPLSWSGQGSNTATSSTGYVFSPEPLVPTWGGNNRRSHFSEAAAPNGSGFPQRSSCQESCQDTSQEKQQEPNVNPVDQGIEKEKDLLLSSSRELDKLTIPQDCCAVCWMDGRVAQTQTVLGCLTSVNVFCNSLIVCSGCQVSVHRLCYGVWVAPGVNSQAKWYCSVCEYWMKRGYSSRCIEASGGNPHATPSEGSSSLALWPSKEGQLVFPRVRCALCLRSGGAMRIGPEQLWVHVSCVLFCSEGPCFGCLALLHHPMKIRCSLAQSVLKNEGCCLCQRCEGHTVGCSYTPCSNRVHISCAFLAHLRPSLEWVVIKSTAAKRLMRLVFCTVHSSAVCREETLEKIRGATEPLVGAVGTQISRRGKPSGVLETMNEEALWRSAHQPPNSAPLVDARSIAVNAPGGASFDLMFKRRLPPNAPIHRHVFGDPYGRLLHRDVSSPSSQYTAGLSVDVRQTVGPCSGLKRPWWLPSMDQGWPFGSEEWPGWANLKGRGAHRKDSPSLYTTRPLSGPAFQDTSEMKKSMAGGRSPKKGLERFAAGPSPWSSDSGVGRSDPRVTSRLPHSAPLAMSGGRTTCKTKGVLSHDSLRRGGEKRNNAHRKSSSIHLKSRLKPSCGDSGVSLDEGCGATPHSLGGPFLTSSQLTWSSTKDAQGTYRADKGINRRGPLARPWRDAGRSPTKESFRSRDRRGRPRRCSRPSMHSGDDEAQAPLQHLGMGAHIILRGIRLKWSRYDSLFKPIPFLSAAVATIRDGSLPSLECVFTSFVSHVNTSFESSLHFLGLFLLARDPPLRVQDYCTPLPAASPLPNVIQHDRGAEAGSSLSSDFKTMDVCWTLKCHMVYSFLTKSLAGKSVSPKHGSSKVFNLRRSTHSCASNTTPALRLNYTSPTRAPNHDDQTISKASSTSPDVSTNPVNSTSLDPTDAFFTKWVGYSSWLWYDGPFEKRPESFSFGACLDMWRQRLQHMRGQNQPVDGYSGHLQQPPLDTFLHKMMEECPNFPVYVCIFKVLTHMDKEQLPPVEWQRLMSLFLTPYSAEVSSEKDEKKRGFSHFMSHDLWESWSYDTLGRFVRCFEQMLRLTQHVFFRLDAYYSHLFLFTLSGCGALSPLLDQLHRPKSSNLSALPWETPLYKEEDVCRVVELMKQEEPVSELQERWSKLMEAQKQWAGGHTNAAQAVEGLPSVHLETPPHGPTRPWGRRVTQCMEALQARHSPNAIHRELRTCHSFTVGEEHVDSTSFYLRFIGQASQANQGTHGEPASSTFLLAERLDEQRSSWKGREAQWCGRGVSKTMDKSRYALVRDMLWDLQIPSVGLDPAIVGELLGLKRVDTLGVPKKKNECLEPPTSIHEEPLAFVQQQLAWHLSLLKRCTDKLYRYKEIYHHAILLDEMMPRKIFEMPQCEKPLNALFTVASKWGRVSSQCVRGLKDHREADGHTGGGVAPKHRDKGEPCLEKLASLPLGRVESPLASLGWAVPNARGALVQTLSLRDGDAPLFGVAFNRVKTCCICFEGEWESGHPIFMCSRCCICVHKGCYAVADLGGDEENDVFFCKRCDVERRRHGGGSSGDFFVSGSVRCEACNTLGGALKRTRHGSWIHLLCALSLLPEAVPGDVETLDGWDTSQVDDWRRTLNCSICCMADWKQHVRPTGDSTHVQLTPHAFSDPWNTAHLDSYPLRLAEASPHGPLLKYHAKSRGVCVVCFHPGCQTAFHPLCAWMAGMFVQVLSDSTSFYPWATTLYSTPSGASQPPVSVGSSLTQDLDKPFPVHSLHNTDLSPKSDDLVSLFFPQVRFRIYCFRHTPIDKTVPRPVRDSATRMGSRSTSYQRCWRQRRYINRDLYPHLCNGSGSLILPPSESRVVKSSASQEALTSETYGGIPKTARPHRVEATSLGVANPHRVNPQPDLWPTNKTASVPPFDSREPPLSCFPDGTNVWYLDQYADSSCAVCFVAPYGLDEATPQDSGDSSLTLDHCRRCGLAVHSLCYNGSVFESRFFNPQCFETLLTSHVTCSSSQLAHGLTFLDLELEQHKKDHVNAEALVTYALQQATSPPVEKQIWRTWFLPQLKEGVHRPHPIHQQVHFTCEVCANGRVIEHVSCLLCSRRGGALRLLNTDVHSDQLTSATCPSIDVFVHSICATYCPLIPLETSCRYFRVPALEQLTQSRFFNTNPCALCLSNQGIVLPCTAPGCVKFHHVLCLKQHGGFVALRSCPNATGNMPHGKHGTPESHTSSDQSVRVVHYCLEHSQQRLGPTLHVLFSVLTHLYEAFETLRLQATLVRQRALMKQLELARYMESLRVDKPLPRISEPLVPKGDATLLAPTHSTQAAVESFVTSNTLGEAGVEGNTQQLTQPKDNYRLHPENVSSLYSRCFRMAQHVAKETMPDLHKEEFSLATDLSLDMLPSLGNTSLEELLGVSQVRTLTIAELVDVSRMLLPEYQRRRRGRPSAKEKLVRMLTTGVLEYIKSQKREEETLAQVVKRIRVDDESLSALPFWNKASLIAEQYGRSFQSILCGPQKSASDSVVTPYDKGAVHHSSTDLTNRDMVHPIFGDSINCACSTETVQSRAGSEDMASLDDVDRLEDLDTMAQHTCGEHPKTCPMENEPQEAGPPHPQSTEKEGEKHYGDPHSTGNLTLVDNTTPPLGDTEPLEDCRAFQRIHPDTTEEARDGSGCKKTIQDPQHLIDQPMGDSKEKDDAPTTPHAKTGVESTSHSSTPQLTWHHEVVQPASPQDNQEDPQPLSGSAEAQTPSPPLSGGGKSREILEKVGEAKKKIHLHDTSHEESCCTTPQGGEWVNDQTRDVKASDASPSTPKAKDEPHNFTDLPLLPGALCTTDVTKKRNLEALGKQTKEEQHETHSPNMAATFSPISEAVDQDVSTRTVTWQEDAPALGDVDSPDQESALVGSATSPCDGEDEEGQKLLVDDITKNLGCEKEKPSMQSSSPLRRPTRQSRAARHEPSKATLSEEDACATPKQSSPSPGGEATEHVSIQDTNAFSCIATRLRRSVRQPVSLKVHSKDLVTNDLSPLGRVAAPEFSKKATEEPKLSSLVQTHSLGKHHVWFDDVLEALLRNFPCVPEGLRHSYVMCLLALPGGTLALDVRVSPAHTKQALDLSPPPHPLLWKDEQHITLNLPEGPEGIKLRHAASLFSRVPLGMLTFSFHQLHATAAGSSLSSHLGVLSNQVLCVLNHLRLAKDPDHVPLLSFLFLEPENQHLFGAVYGQAFQGKIKSFKQLTCNFLNLLKVPGVHCFAERENVIWPHFASLASQAPDKLDESLDNLAHQSWIPRHPSSRLLKRTPLLTSDHLKAVVNYFRHLILWLLKHCDTGAGPLPPIPGWDTVDASWNGSLSFGVLALGRCCRFFHVESWSWREGLVVAYDGAPAKSLSDFGKPGTESKCTGVKTSLVASRTKLARLSAPVSTKHLCNELIKRQISRPHRQNTSPKGSHDKLWRLGDLVYVNPQCPDDPPVFEWKSLLAFEIVEFQTHSTCDLARLMALDARYHLRCLLVQRSCLASSPPSPTVSCQSTCIQCGVELFSYWESDSPSEYLECRRVKPVVCSSSKQCCGWLPDPSEASRELIHQPPPSYHLRACANRVCRPCVVNWASQHLGTSQDPSWSCTLCDMEEPCINLTEKQRHTSSHVPTVKRGVRHGKTTKPNSAMAKDVLDKRINSVLRCSTFPSTGVHSKKLNLKQERQKSWPINLNGSDKKRQRRTELKDVAHYNASTKRLRKHK